MYGKFFPGRLPARTTLQQIAPGIAAQTKSWISRPGADVADRSSQRPWAVVEKPCTLFNAGEQTMPLQG